MKLFKNISIFCILLFIFTILPKNIFGNKQNITEIDPLVTKSYIDSIISSLNINSNQNILSDDFIKIISESIKDQVLKEINSKTNENKIELNKEEITASYIPVFVNKGKILICGSGTEIILRSGKAKVYTVGLDGIVNITKGKEKFNEDEIEENNMLVVPRADGRGALALSDTWFLVKGSYIIK